MILNFTQTLLDQVSIKMLQIMAYDWNHFSKTILDVIIKNEVPLCMHLLEGCGIYFRPGTMAGGIDSSALHFLCLLYLEVSSGWVRYASKYVQLVFFLNNIFQKLSHCISSQYSTWFFIAISIGAPRQHRHTQMLDEDSPCSKKIFLNWGLPLQGDQDRLKNLRK